ncbi:MAG TPA: DNA primase [Verrucomicrobiae bacterium]|nr:DNA primase [Verrucomicrobiae bacterium]
MDSTRNIPDEVKDRLTIEQVVGSYVPLKKAGRIYKALCPFHGEKTPSFTVSPDRGVFKCFGCGKGGDIFDFVSEIEGLTFPETLKLLADKAGVAMPEWKPERSNGQSGPGKARLFEINEFVANLWHKVLISHEKGQPAREYLAGRGISEESVRNFRVGYAPYGSGTGSALTQRQFSRLDLQAAGDPAKFQDRIIFPIADLTGKVVGFTGRLLELPDDPKDGASRGPKYWNTPETAVFIKSRTVYALHLAKHAIQKEGIAILAEGQMDVVALHQAGYTQAVASSGTALTQEQLKLIGRFAPVVAFAYDNDKAGREATKRGIELALENDLTPYVISMPSGNDPADVLQKDPAIWQEAYNGRAPFMEWLINQEVGQVTDLTAEKKKEVAITMVKWLGRLQSISEQDSWIPFIAARLQTDEKNIRLLFKSLFPNRPAAEQRQERVEQPHSDVINLAERALALLIAFPAAYPPLKVQLIQSLKLVPQTGLVEKIFPVIESHKEDTPFDELIDTLYKGDDRKELDLRIEDLLKPYNDIELTPSWAVTELSLILQRIRSDSRAQIKQHIAEEISRAQALGDSNKVRELFQELQNLI